MSKPENNIHVFTSNENGLRFDVTDPVTLKTVSNPEKKEIVSRLDETKQKSKGKKELADNEQTL